jgi:hypothetical protein
MVTNKDPRRDSRYIVAARRYLAALTHASCCLCGRPVDMQAPRTSPYGATIEHRYPVRHIKAMAQNWDEVIALTCDTSLWSVAHRRCNSRQGAIAVNKMRGVRRQIVKNSSREW